MVWEYICTDSTLNAHFCHVLHSVMFSSLSCSGGCQRTPTQHRQERTLTKTQSHTRLEMTMMASFCRISPALHLTGMTLIVVVVVVLVYRPLPPPSSSSLYLSRSLFDCCFFFVSSSSSSMSLSSLSSSSVSHCR